MVTGDRNRLGYSGIALTALVVALVVLRVEAGAELSVAGSDYLPVIPLPGQA